MLVNRAGLTSLHAVAASLPLDLAQLDSPLSVGLEKRASAHRSSHHHKSHVKSKPKHKSKGKGKGKKVKSRRPHVSSARLWALAAQYGAGDSEVVQSAS